MTRTALFRDLTNRVRRQRADRPRLVAVDGVDGAGKTMFADAWADHLAAHGVPCTRVGIDSFHRPRVERYGRGRDSPEGFFHDSYDLATFRRVVVEPVVRGDGLVRTAVFDHLTDTPVAGTEVAVRPGEVVLVDGLFLLRPELADVWDLSVHLRVPFEVTFARMAVRDGVPADPRDPRNLRYVVGQELYLATGPEGRADVVVENSDPARPRPVRAVA